MSAQMLEATITWGDREDLIQQLLNLVEINGHAGFAARGNEGSTAVLLDIQLNGVRYVLTRKDMPAASSDVTLSPREHEVARLVSRGLSNKEVATILNISIWTVSTHLRRIFTKLDVCSRAEMIAKALQENLLNV